MSKTIFFVILSLLFVFAAGTRLLDLGADAPSVFAGGSQDFTTDGAYTTLHARNAVRYGDWDLFGDQYWRPLKITLVSGLSYLIFTVFGPSRATANLTGALLNLLSLIIFVVALGRGAPYRRTIFTAAFLSLSFLLCSFARVPFAENGLLLIAALIFAVYRFWFDRLWGKILVGLLIALGSLFGKAFGVLILVGPVLAILTHRDGRRGRDLLALLAAFFGSAIALAALVYGNQGFLNFVLDRGIEDHGALHILETWLGYPENLISFAASGFHRFTPILSLTVYFVLLQMLLGNGSEWRDKRVTLFMLSWIVLWLVALSVFNYRPIRYMYVLVIPMAALAGPFVESLSQVRFGPSKATSWWRILLLVLLNWYLAYYAVVLPLTPVRNADSYFHLVWYALPVGVLLTGALLLFTWRRAWGIPGTLAKVLTVLVLLLISWSEGRQFKQWYVARTRNIEEANADLGQILGPDAVIGGPYGPSLTADNHLRGFLYGLPTDMDTAVQQLQGYPVTHLAVAKSDWAVLASTNPGLLKMPVAASYWLRDRTVLILRVNKSLRPSEDQPYQLSDFELSGAWLGRHNADSSHFYLNRFLTAHPSNKSALLRNCALENWDRDARMLGQTIDTLARLYPTDFWVDFVAAVYYKWLSASTGSQEFRNRSERFLELAMRYNRADEASLRRRYETANSPDQLFPPVSQ